MSPSWLPASLPAPLPAPPSAPTSTTSLVAGARPPRHLRPTGRPPTAADEDLATLVRRADLGDVAWQVLVHEGAVQPLTDEVGLPAGTVARPWHRAAALAPRVPRGAVLVGRGAVWVHLGGPPPAGIESTRRSTVAETTAETTAATTARAEGDAPGGVTCDAPGGVTRDVPGDAPGDRTRRRETDGEGDPQAPEHLPDGSGPGPDEASHGRHPDRSMRDSAADEPRRPPVRTRPPGRDPVRGVLRVGGVLLPDLVGTAVDVALRYPAEEALPLLLRLGEEGGLPLDQVWQQLGTRAGWRGVRRAEVTLRRALEATEDTTPGEEPVSRPGPGRRPSSPR